MDFKDLLGTLKGSAPYLLVSVAVLVVFSMLGLHNQRALNELSADIAKTRVDIEEQKLMAPLYKELIEKIKVKTKKNLPFPAREKLAKDKHEQISAVFSDLARRANLEVVSITPDVNSLVGGSGLVVVNASLKGDFFNFRNFLVELGAVPYMEHVSEIQIQQAAGKKEFRLKIWVAVG